MIQVILVDDHALVRSGIKRMLADIPGIDVIAEAGSGEEAILLVRQGKPDVVLMDVNMPGNGGLEATRKLLLIDPTIKIIAVTVHGNEPFPSHFMQAGAAGYLTKDCGIDEIVRAIETVYKGGRYIAPGVAQNLALSLLPGGAESPFDKLSSREMQVMLMVAKGIKVPDISDKLCLSPKTVNTYRYRLFEKLGVQGDVELTHLAMRYRMIED
ncbi:MAG: UvrY/SirA/GacA family response regulator transcription factor [Gammaproteobacteria bacterium]|nr:UvrY/SirA/GacA family response regulator transcription factor [Gammaproteobacteria bacterium]